MYTSSRSPPRWIASKRSPALATTPWKSVDVGFDTRLVTSDVDATKPQATASHRAT